MYMIFLLTFVACEPWMHSVHLYGSENHPSFQQTSSILYDHVVRRIVLQDQRTISCNIPLDPTFSITADLLNSLRETKSTIAESVSSQTSLQILYPLLDQCAYYNTQEFVWEYCFKKYVRQYDDAQTVRNMQKNQYEEFFIGYSTNYNAVKNQTVGMYVPFWANLKLNSIYHLVMYNSYNSTLLSVAVAEKHTFKITNPLQKLTFNQSYAIEIILLEEDLTPQLIKSLPLSAIKDSRGYIINLSVHCVVHKSLLILNESTPFTIITHRYKIYRTEKIAERLNKDQLYVRGKFIFGSNLKAHQHFYKGLRVAININNTLHLSVVNKIIDTFCVEMEEEFPQQATTQRARPIQLIILDNPNYVYSTSSVSIIGHAVLGEKDTFKVGDLILTFKPLTFKPDTTIQYCEFHVVKAIVMDSIAILDQSLNYRGNIIVGSKAIKVKSQTKSVESSPFYSFIDLNEDEASQFMSLQNIILDSSPYFVRENLRFEILTDTKNVYGFYFRLNGLDVQAHYQMSIKLTSAGKDIEILFLSEPSPCIYVREYGVKGLYTKMDSRFFNQTLLNRDYWIVMDHEQQKLLLGQGDQLSMASLMLSYSFINTQEPTNLWIEFLGGVSNGVRVSSIVGLNLAEYRPRKLPWQLSEPQFNTLNFSGFAYVEAQGDTKLQHIEVYPGGSFCPAVNAPRVIEVRLVCSKNSLMEILRITEPKICVYRMDVGTSLLCDPDELLTTYPSESMMGQMIICTIDD